MKFITVELDIMGQQFKGIVDTGATSRFIPLERRIVKYANPRLELTDGRI